MAKILCFEGTFKTQGRMIEANVIIIKIQRWIIFSFILNAFNKFIITNIRLTIFRIVGITAVFTKRSVFTKLRRMANFKTLKALKRVFLVMGTGVVSQSFLSKKIESPKHKVQQSQKDHKI
jgi:hypothetical protein